MAVDPLQQLRQRTDPPSLLALETLATVTHGDDDGGGYLDDGGGCGHPSPAEAEAPPWLPPPCRRPDPRRERPSSSSTSRKAAGTRRSSSTARQGRSKRHQASPTQLLLVTKDLGYHDSVRYSRGEGVHGATHIGLGVFHSSATSAVLFGIGYTVCLMAVELLQRFRRLAWQAEG